MIIGEFSTRRDAELAVERLVQEHGIERRGVSVQAGGPSNTAGSEIAGADIESGHPGVEKHGRPELSGPIEVSVDCGGQQVATVEGALKEAGARRLRTQ